MDICPVEQLIVGLGCAAAASADIVLVDLAAVRALPLVFLRLALGDLGLLRLFFLCGLFRYGSRLFLDGLLNEVGMNLRPVEQLIVRLGCAASAGADIVLIDLAAAGTSPLILFRLALGDLGLLRLFFLCGFFRYGSRLFLSGLLNEVGMNLRPVEQLIVRLRRTAAAGADVVLVDLAAARALPLMRLGLTIGLGLFILLLVRLRRRIGKNGSGLEERASLALLTRLDKGIGIAVERGKGHIFTDHRALIQAHYRFTGIELHDTVFIDLIKIEHLALRVFLTQQ